MGEPGSGAGAAAHAQTAEWKTGQGAHTAPHHGSEYNIKVDERSMMFEEYIVGHYDIATIKSIVVLWLPLTSIMTYIYVDDSVIEVLIVLVAYKIHIIKWWKR